MADGFTSYVGIAKLYIVYHDQGTTHVHATSEAIALQRFMAKYPNRSVRKIERAYFLDGRPFIVLFKRCVKENGCKV